MPTLLPRRVPTSVTDPAVTLLSRWGVTPNMLTLTAFAGNVAAGVFCALGLFLPAGIVMLAFSALDVLDGALARATGQATDFGSVFDAVMDRLSEAVVLFGLLVWFSDPDRGGEWEELFIFATVVGSLLVSYVRARAEIIGFSLRDGWFTREVRVAVLGIGLILDEIGFMDDVITWVLGGMAVLTLVTAAQRLWLVWVGTRDREASGEGLTKARDDSP
jgi:CDP-diacylglycerol--glycerol-3-phosphate 3-phosphatidyltransferase